MHIPARLPMLIIISVAANWQRGSWQGIIEELLAGARWRSSYAAVCKTAYTGANPVGASINKQIKIGRVAELVYAADLKSAGLNNLVGSSPTSPTNIDDLRSACYNMGHV